ncbi:MAG: tetratricopeptide repeat protein [Planctomycetaceae bacterium]
MYDQLKNKTSPFCKQIIFAIATLIILNSGAIAQDRITQVGVDKAITGKITGMTNQEISLETRRDGVLKVTPNQVLEIKWDDEPPRFSAGRSYEEKGMFQRAYEAYQEALTDLEPDHPMIKADIEFHILRLKARMVMSGATLPDNQKPADLINALKTFLDQHKENYVYYPGRMILGRLAHQQGNPDALQYFLELQETPWTNYQIWGFTAQGHQQLGENKIPEAIASFEKALSLPFSTKEDEIARAEATLGKANALTAQQKTTEAIPLIDELIKTIPAEAAETQARIYLAQGKIYQQLGRNEEAVVALLHVDILYPQSAPEHAESLYYLSKLWAAMGQPDRATTASSQLSSDYPDSRWASEMNTN